MTLRSLVTQSHWCKDLKHELLDQESDTLVVLLGGQGYTTENPLLYYCYNLVESAGYDVLSIKYGFIQNPTQTEFPRDFDKVFSDTKEVLALALLSRHKKIVFIGKSLGTVLIRYLRLEYKALEQRIVYLTPVTYAFDSEDPFEKLILVGTGDAHYDEMAFASEEESVIIEFEGADHSLQVGQALEDIDILKQVIGAIGGYLDIEI